jgi:hypothetical protein
MSIWLMAILSNLVMFIAEWVIFYVSMKLSPPDSIVLTILGSLILIGLLFGVGSDRLDSGFDLLFMQSTEKMFEGFATLMVLAIGTPVRWSVLGLCNLMIVRSIIKENSQLVLEQKKRK